MTLKSFLEKRIQQLEHRRMMIPRYVKRPEAFAGKKDHSLDDLPKIEADISETKAALKAVVEHQKRMKVSVAKDSNL